MPTPLWCPLKVLLPKCRAQFLVQSWSWKWPLGRPCFQKTFLGKPLHTNWHVNFRFTKQFIWNVGHSSQQSVTLHFMPSSCFHVGGIPTENGTVFFGESIFDSDSDCAIYSGSTTLLSSRAPLEKVRWGVQRAQGDASGSSPTPSILYSPPCEAGCSLWVPKGLPTPLWSFLYTFSCIK